MNNRKKLFFTIYHQPSHSMHFGLVKARVRTPINPRFINSALGWKGNAWKMIVVGTRKMSNSEAPIFSFLPETKKIEPITMQIIAATNKNAAIGSGIPLLATRAKSVVGNTN